MEKCDNLDLLILGIFLFFHLAFLIMQKDYSYWNSKIDQTDHEKTTVSFCGFLLILVFAFIIESIKFNRHVLYLFQYILQKERDLPCSFLQVLGE